MRNVTVTESNISEIAEIMPCDIRAELRVGCIVSRAVGAWLCVWTDTGRGAVCYGGDSAWGDYNETERTITLDDTDADGERIVVDVDDFEDMPTWRD